MLDPFSCLAIATAIAQFVDFGADLLKTTQKVYRGGGTVESVRDFEADVIRFQGLSANLPKPKKGEDASVRRDGHELILVGEQCDKLATEILDFLGKLKIENNPSKLKSMKLAFKIEMRTKEVEEYQKKIMARKADLTLQLVKVLDSRQSTVYTMLEKLRERDIALETKLAGKLDTFKADLVQMLQTSQAVSAKDIQGAVAQVAAEARNVAKVQYLLSSLRFNVIRAREAAISDTHAQTFNWILDETQPGPFFRWLREGSGLFWVSGKAGSGKSTLLKFLFEHPKTTSILNTWGTKSKVILSRHFFWNSGTDLQKSQVGLMRALCYDVFCACPDILAKVCAERLRTLSLDKCLNPDFLEQEYWSPAELSQMIETLSQYQSSMHNSQQSLKFCFFIDGLDEYAGQQDDIIAYVNSLATLPNIKVCVSSRPWNIFESAFAPLQHQDRMLILQDLTRNDISLYVRNRLEDDSRFIQMLSMDQRCASLVQEITDKADGVFLWVFLVINELLKSLTNYDDFHTLRKRLHRIPPTLEAYFQHMFDTLEEFYQTETAQIFRVTIEAPHYVPVLAFTVLQPHDPLAVRIATDFQSVANATERKEMGERLRKRIQGRCRDLLEVKNFKVSFLHRTVKDFLSTPEMEQLLNSRVGEGFDLETSMCLISMVGLKYLSYYLETSSGDRDTMTWFLPSFYHYARQIERNTHAPPIRILDEQRALLADIHDSWVQDLPPEMAILAAHNLPLALEKRLQDSLATTKWKKDLLVDSAWYALQYLMLPAQFSGDGNMARLLSTSWDKDPDRQGFDPSILTMLMKHDAKVGSAAWRMYLGVIRENRDCPPAVRSKYLQVATHMIEAGAALSHTQTEAEALADVFGHADAQWLMSLCEGNGNQRLSWLPFTWFRK